MAKVKVVIDGKVRKLSSEWINVRKFKSDGYKLARVAHCMDNFLREENERLHKMMERFQMEKEDFRSRIISHEDVMNGIILGYFNESLHQHNIIGELTRELRGADVELNYYRKRARAWNRMLSGFSSDEMTSTEELSDLNSDEESELSNAPFVDDPVPAFT